ncbi:hypothetical protein LXM94_15900 [Rhizobium sp. TRM95111]|uniref:hypothetical protein n=1 Tax=Rhizobium alarense TaxID=2846851 RepID=UPI001F1998CE|nr:hypothetical protein [Rhizobium alarense]MCF3641457.1 hypothetical protein [Rhizobium alarense]
MTALLVIGATVLLLALMSLAAGRRIAPRADRLTMQWRRDGTPRWSLPRTAALSFTPALALATLAAVAFAGGSRSALLFVSATFVGAHALHLFLLRKRG